MMAMTADEVKSALSSMDFSVSRLRTSASLSALTSEVSKMTQDLSNQESQLKELRDQGYVFDDELEEKIRKNTASWRGTRTSIEAEIRRKARELDEEMETIDATVSRLQTLVNRPASAEVSINRAKSDISAFEAEVDTASQVLRSRYSSLQNDINATNSRLSFLKWMMEELHQASFSLLATEAPVTAAKVRWYHDGKEDKKDPEGILFLTDQRLILELHETVVKKKVLFVTTASETTRKLQFESPVAYIDKAEPFQEGMLKGKSHLRIHFTPQGPYDHTQFRFLSGSNDDFSRDISRIQSGEFLRNRTEEVDQEALDRVKNAPSICPSCGGTIAQKILRGQQEITCEYCGFVIRL
jgi:ribulose bisphosphate carboxylase small subunit